MAIREGCREGSMLALDRQERHYRAWVSLLVLCLLGMQAATYAVTLVRPGWLRARLYPIIEYPMYAQAHYENERVTGRWLVRGLLANGSEIDITAQSLRISPWDFVLLTDPIGVGPQDAPAAIGARDRLIAIVREREPRAAEITALRIDNYPMRVTRNGPETVPSEAVVTVPMPAIASSGH